MTKNQFEQLLRGTGCDENTVRFALNAFEMGMESRSEFLSERIASMPFGDTAASFSVWVREYGNDLPES
jgi:hypothetical protein